MDEKLVEPFNPDELERPRKIVRSNPSKKIEGRLVTKWRREKDALTIVPNEAPQPDRPTAATNGSSLPSSENGVPLPPNARAEEPTSRKGKEKMAMQPENAFEDEVRKELRELKEAITMSRREAKAIARSQKETTTHLGQSSAGPSNHMEGIDVHRGQPVASLKTKSASIAEYKNTVARMLEECKRAVERNTSIEEELVIAQHKIAKLEQRVTKASVETSYLSICNDFKLAAASHRSPQLVYEHLKSIFDLYINPDNHPDVEPLVKGLDAEDFDVDVFLGTDMGGCKEEMTPDFLDGLSVHDARRLEYEIENIRGEPQRITRATACLRLNYEQDILPPPTAKENVTDSTVGPIVGCSIDLTTDEAPHQLDQYSCEIHIIQMLAGARMKELGLDQCWRVEKLASIATIDQVMTMGIMLSGWLNGRFKHVP
ncbi:hypothetical protein R1flu_021339 [Riccia fluitans]|uniref:Uncharacterized protein n=1 Tax=Riccia fluitans TaxID=41844 RepID=A0ABD1ZR30_9MARC